MTEPTARIRLTGSECLIALVAVRNLLDRDESDAEVRAVWRKLLECMNRIEQAEKDSNT